MRIVRTEFNRVFGVGPEARFPFYEQFCYFCALFYILSTIIFLNHAENENKLRC